MFIFRPPSKKKSKCTFLRESQESLKDEVFQEGIFAQDVNGVAVREERHRLSAWVWSAPSGSKAWGCPWCRGLGCPPVHSLSLQTWEETQEPAWAGQRWGKVSGPPLVTASEPVVPPLLPVTCHPEQSLRHSTSWGRCMHELHRLQISLKEMQRKHERLMPVHRWLSSDGSHKHRSANMPVRPCMLSVEKSPTFHCSPLAKIACAGPKHMQ